MILIIIKNILIIPIKLQSIIKLNYRMTIKVLIFSGCELRVTLINYANSFTTIPGHTGQ